MSEYKRLTKHHVYFDKTNGYEALGHGMIEQRPFFELIRKLCEYEDIGSPEEFAELAKAKAEGRLVVLPVKLETPIVKVIKHCTQAEFGDCIGCYRYIDGKCATEYWERGFKYCDIGEFGKTVFLTREEAEAALKQIGVQNE